MYCKSLSYKGSLKKMLLLMKMTAALMLIVSLHVSAAGFSQKIDLAGNNLPLGQVFKTITRQTGYEFLYNPRDIKGHVVSINVKGSLFTDVLTICLKNTGLRYVLDEKTILIGPAEKTETIPDILLLPPVAFIVRGRVLNNTDEPLAGAAVQLKGTNKGTLTDNKGDFHLTIPDSSGILEISYVGYIKKEIRAKSYVTVRLEPRTTAINDVVITGYSTVDKRLSASAVTTINGSDLERKDLFSVDNMLQGKVPGLNINMNSGTPGAAPKIRLRGTSTLIGNREPVWVVDGVIVEPPVKLESQQINSLDDINLLSSSIIGVNPNDIDRIDILKDASATALYGVKGGNGVIVITTKRGRYNQAPSVSYSTNLRVGLKPSYDNFKLMNSKDRVDVSKEITGRALTYRFQPSRIGYEGAYLDYIDRKISFDEFNEKAKYFGKINTDWFDILFRNSMDQSHNVSFNGGGQNANYYASLGYARQNGVALFTNNERFTGLLKFNSQLNRNLIIGVKFSGAFNAGEYPYKMDPFEYAYNTSRALPFSSEDGTRFKYANVNNPALVAEIQANRNLFAEFNVMDELEHSRQKTDVRTWDATVDIDWKFLKNFRYRGVMGIATSQTRGNSYADEFTSYVAQNYREYYSQTATIPPERKIFVEMPRGGEYIENNTFRNTYTIRNSIEYTRTLNHHFFQLTAGTEIRHNAYDISKIFRLGYLPERGMTFYNPERTEYPKYYNDVATGRFNPLALSNKIERQTSLYGILIYSLKNRYTFNFNIRNDGSNRFGTDISDRFLPTFSGAFRWMASDEKFFGNSNWVNLLALRLSYGYNGNVPETESPRMILSQPSIDPISGTDQSTVVKYANPLLRWEKTSTVNAGLEFSLFDNRLSGEADAYYKRGTDLIASISIAPSNGINSYALNQASVENYGIEAILKYDAIRQKDWNWSLNVVFGRNYSKVLKANYEKSPELVGINGYLSGNTIQAGVNPNDMYSFIFRGLDNMGPPTFKDLFYASYDRKRPEITTYFNTILENSGSRVPLFDGSFGSNIRYKRFTFYASFIVKLGYVKRMEKFFKANGMIPAPHENTSSELVNRWRQPGDESNTSIPKITDERVTIIANTAANSDQTPYFIASYLYDIYNNSDIRTVNASHVRLSAAALQYKLPVMWGKRKLANSAIVRLQGNDLFVLANRNFNGQDPETVNGTLPRLPSFSLSLDITF